MDSGKVGDKGLTALVAGGHTEQLPFHLKRAVENGVTREEIREVLLQVAIYAGVPAANTGFAHLKRSLAQRQETS